VKAALRDGSVGGMVLSKEAATVAAVFVAQFPYWALRNPSEVIKTRAQAKVQGRSKSGGSGRMDDKGEDMGLWATTKRTVEEEGTGVLYNGYKENILYAFPADALKFGIYEKLLGGRSKKSIPPLEGAVLGAVSTALAQAMTTPLDVVRNRVMVEQKGSERGGGGDEGDGERGGEGRGQGRSLAERGYFETIGDIAREEGIATLFAGTSPRIGKAVLSGFVQFGTYELTKGSMASFFQGRK